MVEWRDVVPSEMVVAALEETRAVLKQQNKETLVTVKEVIEILNQCLRGELP
jgi:hypothetical protein